MRAAVSRRRERVVALASRRRPPAGGSPADARRGRRARARGAPGRRARRPRASRGTPAPRRRGELHHGGAVDREPGLDGGRRLVHDVLKRRAGERGLAELGDEPLALGGLRELRDVLDEALEPDRLAVLVVDEVGAEVEGPQLAVGAPGADARGERAPLGERGARLAAEPADLLRARRGGGRPRRPRGRGRAWPAAPARRRRTPAWPSSATSRAPAMRCAPDSSRSLSWSACCARRRSVTSTSTTPTRRRWSMLEGVEGGDPGAHLAGRGGGGGVQLDAGLRHAGVADLGEQRLDLAGGPGREDLRHAAADVLLGRAAVDRRERVRHELEPELVVVDGEADRRVGLERPRRVRRRRTPAPAG